MGLISLEAAIEALEFERDCLETPERINGVEDEIEVIQHLSSVPAVPLEPLCQWLAGYATPPKYALKAVATTSYRLGVVFTANERVEAWKYHFRELLKSGLMNTEGEDAEKEET